MASDTVAVPAESTVVGRPSRGFGALGRYVTLGVLGLIVAFPIYIVLLNSVLPARDVTNGRLLPRIDLDWGNYSKAWSGEMARYLGNSLLVAALITIGQIATSILAAYAFVFLRFRGRSLFFFLVLATLMVPSEVTIVSNFQTISSLGWNNSYLALVVPFTATAVGIFLLRQTFLGVPRDLRDAAALDGYGHMGFLWRVVVPLSRPAIGALAVFGFLGAWNQYLWPLFVTDEEKYRTVQIGLKGLVEQNAENLPVAMAATVIAALPLVILLIVFQKQLIRGLTAGAVKG